MDNSLEQRLFQLEQQLTNKTLVASDVVASLNPEQREELADLTIQASTLNEHATFVKLYDRLDYDTMELTGRYLEQDTGSVSAGRTPATNKVQFDPKDVKAVLPLHHSYLRRLAPNRDPIEQKAEMIASAMAKVVANDLEKMVWYSNLLGPSIAEADYLNNGSGSTTNRIKDATFSLFNGVLAASDAAGSTVLTFDANNSADIQAIMHNIIKKLPADYRKEKEELRFYVPSNVEENLRSYLKLRDTAVGDISLTEDNQIMFRGILVVSCPLFDVNPLVTEHITLSGTTAVPLKYDNLPSSANVFVNASTLAATPAAPFISGVDYTLNATNGTIARISGGGISDGATVKVTYQVLPSIYLTKRSNFLVAIGVNDMDLSTQWFADEGVWKIVGRTRVDFKFVKQGWVARAINVQDAVAAS
jgi:hypothetical protein